MLHNVQRSFKVVWNHKKPSWLQNICKNKNKNIWNWEFRLSSQGSEHAWIQSSARYTPILSCRSQTREDTIFSVTVRNHNTPKQQQSRCSMTGLGGFTAAASLQRCKSQNIKMKFLFFSWKWCSLMQLERKVAKGLVNPDNLSSLLGDNERSKNGFGGGLIDASLRLNIQKQHSAQKRSVSGGASTPLNLHFSL